MRSTTVLEMSRTWWRNLQNEPSASVFTEWKVFVRSTDTEVSSRVSPRGKAGRKQGFSSFLRQEWSEKMRMKHLRLLPRKAVSLGDSLASIKAWSRGNL